MEVTDDMLQAAMKKAVEAGLLPRHATEDELRINRELIRTVVQAAVEKAAMAGMQAEYRSSAASKPRSRFLVLARMAHPRGHASSQ